MRPGQRRIHCFPTKLLQDCPNCRRNISQDRRVCGNTGRWPFLLRSFPGALARLAETAAIALGAHSGFSGLASHGSRNHRYRSGHIRHHIPRTSASGAFAGSATCHAGFLFTLAHAFPLTMSLKTIELAFPLQPGIALPETPPAYRACRSFQENSFRYML